MDNKELATIIGLTILISPVLLILFFIFKIFLLEPIMLLFGLSIIRIQSIFRTKYKIIPYNEYYIIILKSWYMTYYLPYYFDRYKQDGKTKEYVTIREAEEDIKQIKKIYK